MPEVQRTIATRSLFPYLERWVDWEALEDEIPGARRLSFMDTVEWFNAMYGKTGNPDYIHAFDMNADRLIDYAYYGPGPGFDTKEMISIFNINGKVISVLGTLKALDFEQGVLKKLYVEKAVEKSSRNVMRQIAYEAAYDNGKPTLKTTFQSETAEGTELPFSLYSHALKKRLCVDSIILNPGPRNKIPSRYQRLTNNYGLILGESVNSTNGKWLFMAVPALNESPDNNDTIYQAGWTPEVGLRQ